MALDFGDMLTIDKYVALANEFAGSNDAVRRSRRRRGLDAADRIKLLTAGLDIAVVAALPRWQDDAELVARFGDITLQAEYARKETRTARASKLRLREFVESYRQTDVHLVSFLPPEMQADVHLPQFLSCRPHAAHLDTHNLGSAKALVINLAYLVGLVAHDVLGGEVPPRYADAARRDRRSEAPMGPRNSR